MHTINEPNELLHFINGIKTDIKYKNANGEVFTPLYLVDEMLDKLDKAYINEHGISIFKVQELKWFDPAAGIGNFQVILYQKLMEGLPIDDEEERRKHILQNMIYSAELTSKNVFIYKKIFCGDKYKLNIYEGDTLNMDVKKEFGIDKFDVVMGNPPFNDDSGNKGKGHTLWDKFTLVSINIWLKFNGYLLYIHPRTWRQINHKILEIFKKYQLHYLEIHNVEDGIKTFKCSTTYDWYILEKKKKYTNTIIKDEENKINHIDISNWSFIPNKMFDKIQKITEINNNSTLDVNYYRSNYGADKKWVSKIKNDEFKYPVVYTINKSNVLSLRYSNTNKKDMFNKSKFIFSNGAGFYCDKNGEYGLTQWSYCIYDNKDVLQNIEGVFRSNEFKKIIESIKLDSSNYNINVMKLFKKDFWKDFINILT
tara:strand:+ start:584 stop:1855 length:1272 start_codon:yes stop_codon:yes gene_type:complete